MVAGYVELINKQMLGADEWNYNKAEPAGFAI